MYNRNSNNNNINKQIDRTQICTELIEMEARTREGILKNSITKLEKNLKHYE